MGLSEASRFVWAVRRINGDMSLAQLHCLLIVAQADEGISLSDLAKKAELGLATASRYIGALGRANRHKEEGLKLIETFEDPQDYRRKIIRLTSKGKVELKHILGENNAHI